MTRRAPTYLRQPGDGEGLMPRQASSILIAKFLTGKTILDDALFRANAATTEILNAAGYYK